MDDAVSRGYLVRLDVRLALFHDHRDSRDARFYRPALVDVPPAGDLGRRLQPEGSPGHRDLRAVLALRRRGLDYPVYAVLPDLIGGRKCPIITTIRVQQH